MHVFIFIKERAEIVTFRRTCCFFYNSEYVVTEDEQLLVK
jgi:hypothetical protein